MHRCHAHVQTHISNFGKFLALSANFVCKLEGMAKHMLLWRGGVPNMGKMQQNFRQVFFFFVHIKIKNQRTLIVWISMSGMLNID